MSISTKRQQYPYSFRSTVMANSQFTCGKKVLLYLVPPENAVTIESLWCHFRFTFDSAIGSPLRYIKSIGVCNELPLNENGEPSYHKKFELNEVADVNRQVDIRLDLSSLLNKNNVGFHEYGYDNGDDNYTFVIVEFDDDLYQTLATGTIDLWKLDGLFTTQGIR